MPPASRASTSTTVAGGIGQGVNVPVHSSLTADYYEPRSLPSVWAWYGIGFAAIGLLAGPLAGGAASAYGWRAAFVLLALPTFVFVLLLLMLPEPTRGGSRLAAATATTAT